MTNFLESLNLSDFIEIFILMLGSFLIGYLFAYYYFKNKLSSLKSNFDIPTLNDTLGTDQEGAIKATKTFERGGQEVDESEQIGIEFFVEEKEPKKKPKKS
ncbi:MAG: hypothetical protein QM486_10015 [Flavobacteriaceae bacterium]